MNSDNNHYDKLPNHLLLQKDSIRKIAEDHINNSKKVEMLAAIINIIVDSIVSWVLSSQPADFKDSVYRILVIVLIAVVLGVLTVVILNKYKESKLPLEKSIAMATEKESECTGIFIISHRESSSPNEETKYLTQGYRNTNIPFLLYLHKFGQYRNEENGEWNEMKIKQNLADKLGIEASLIEFIPIGSNSGIKTLLNEEHPKLRIFHYFHVHVQMQYSTFLRISHNVSFKSIQELENDNNSQRYNFDVIKYLADNASSISDESFSLDSPPSLKIIWNITNACSYNCNICATRAVAPDRHELNIQDKKTVLHNILKYGCDKIKEIDFSGGDPFQQDESILIISDTIKILGNDRVCVTTTGKGIENVVHSNPEILYRCEVTLDDTVENGHYERSSNKKYIRDNTTALMNNLSYITHLTINVPIINPKLSSDHIKQLVDSIASINGKKTVTVNLIRFMPVGAATGSVHYNEDPLDFVKTFEKYAKNKHINYRLQCALRGKINGDQCNMFDEKIGIDCAGNVFACAWGGYVRNANGEEYHNISDNPFYLGNLTQDDLYTILHSEKAVVIKSQISEHTPHCRVYNCICSDDHEFTTDCDPLFK